MRCPSPRKTLFPVTCALFTLTSLSAPHSEDWGQLATISSTMGVNAGKLCLGEESRGDIGCPVYAPSVSPTGTLTTTAVSLTTGGTNWGYLGSNGSYLPNLNTTNISATTLNGLDIGTSGTTNATILPNWPDAIRCTNSTYGNRIQYLSGAPNGDGNYYYIDPAHGEISSYTAFTPAQTYYAQGGTMTTTAGCYNKSISQLYAEGKAFNLAGGGISVGGGAPTGQISAFDLAACPSGWSEYIPARGRFLRGIDNGAGNDPSGTRVPGDVQEDGLKSHTHRTGQAGTGSTMAGGMFLRSDVGDSRATTATGGDETRPKNVAVLFCRKN